MVIPDYRTFQRSNELYHYGMPRRSGRYPWGSGDKPYQSAVKKALKGKERSEYFTSERTIPKGTKMFRTTVTNSPSLQKDQPTYVTYLDPDRDLYKGGNIRYRDDKDKSYEHEMVLKEELRIPSRETFKESINEVIKKNPKLLNESVESYLDMLAPKGSFSRWQIETDDDGKHDTSLWDKYVKDSYTIRKDMSVEEQWGSIAVSLGKADKLKDALIADLKKKGYNAMADEAGIGGSGRTVEGIDPLIVFDSSILSVNTTKEITRKEETRSQEDYTKWVKKARTSAYKDKEKW